MIHIFKEYLIESSWWFICFTEVSNVKNSIYQYTKHNMMSNGNVKLG